MINSYDITFVGKDGKYKLNECKHFPTQEEFEEMLDNISGIGIGEINKVVIDNIK